MGASQTKADVLNQVMNEASITVINKTSNSAQASVSQSNTISLSGNTNIKNSVISNKNISNLNMSAIMSSVATGKLQSDLAAAISQAISQQASAFGYASNDTNIKTIVSNKVNQSMTNSTINQALASISQTNIITSSNDTNISGSNLSNINQTDVIVKLISDMNSDIISILSNTGDIKGDLTQKASNPLSDLISGPGLILLVIIGAIVFGFLMFKEQVLTVWKETPPMIKTGLMLALISLVGYLLYKTFMSTDSNGSFRGYGYDYDIIPNSSIKANFINFNNYGIHNNPFY